MIDLRSIGAAGALVCAFCAIPPSSFAAPQDAPAQPQESVATPLFKANVRRVVVDVVVTDSTGQPVPGLTKQDFSVSEDNKPQQVLSFDTTGFDAGMDYLPPKLPPQPPNTFVNLPNTPEKGPLYVLLYDLVNMDNPDQQVTPGDFSIQMTARQQMVKFIQEKPEGARFCIFVWSDGVHLIQGFTSDKAQLMAAIDPNSSKPHIPRVFMMGQNFGANNTSATLDVMKHIAGYLDGLPGRKNLIWFSGGFPLALFPTKDDVPSYRQEIKTTLDKMAQDQIAIYPVDARGVLIGNPHAPTGATGGGGGMTSDARDKGIGDKSPAAAAASQGTNGGEGFSLVSSSYMIEDEIALVTGGRTFHSNNDVAGALLDSTEDGGSFYTLTYSPSNQDYSGEVRKINVQLAKKGYTLSYRRAYYGTDFATASAGANPQSQTADAAPPPRKLGDTLYANMEHGAPIAHQVIFGAHVRTVGPPAMGSPAQMAELAAQPGYFKVRRKSAQARPLPPIPLQRYAIDFTVMARQLQLSAAPLNLELAAAAYDADGNMLNALVSNAEAQAKAASSTNAPAPKAYRARQELDVPLAAQWIRVAVRDANTNRIGAMEIKLPLAPENETAAAPPSKAN
jgi:VWFA-related protein